MTNPVAKRFYNASFSILLLTVALLPLIFLPASIGGFAGIKYAILYVGTLLSVTAWIISQFVEGTMQFPRNRALLGLFVFALLSFTASLFSPNTWVSLWGNIFNFDSFATIGVLVLFAFLVSIFAREQRRLVKLFLTTFFVSIGVILLQIIFFLLRNSTDFSGLFGHVATQGTLVGTWVDFAYYATLTFILALLMIEVLAPKGIFKTLSVFGAIVSVIALVFLNFSTAWLFVVISSLLVFVYKSSVERAIHNKLNPNAEDAVIPETRFPGIAFVSLLIGAFFILTGPSVGASISRTIGLSFSDIRPSFSATMAIARPALAQNPIFGAGPVRFIEQWELYKPVSINNTILWNTPFENGHSTMSTLLVTHGILPVLVLLATFVLVLLLGFRLFNSQYPDRFSRFIAVTSLFMLVLFTSFLFFGNPSIILIVFGFMLIGLLIGVSVMVGKTPLLSFQYLKDPRSSFFIILLLVITSLGTLSAAYLVSTRFLGIAAYNRALRSQTPDQAIARSARALAFSQSDIYWRTLSGLYLNKVRNATEEDRVNVQTYFTQAENAAQAAIRFDGANSLNWATLGEVYQVAVAAKTEGAVQIARDALNRAASSSPTNPSRQVSLASFAISQVDISAAEGYLDKAIELKPDYLDAYVIKAQIRQSQNDTDAARDILRTYTTRFPFSDRGFFVLGTFELNLKNYAAALEAFGRARSVNPQNVEAHLRYISILIAQGNRTQAISELESLKVRFPNLGGIDAQIRQLQNGTAPNSEETPEE